jgi:long-chain acyl-CoA synthetase
MLVGEDRPYCAALLWVADGRSDEAALDAGVIAVNRRLSHPEQVKRWAVLANDLEISGGDLTASLKLKRPAIARHRSQVIDALYGTGPRPPGVLHWSEAPPTEEGVE